MEQKAKLAGRCVMTAAALSVMGLGLLFVFPNSMPPFDDLFPYQRHWWHHLVYIFPPVSVLAAFLRMQRYRFDGFLPARYILPLFFSIAYVGLWALVSLLSFMMWAGGNT